VIDARVGVLRRSLFVERWILMPLITSKYNYVLEK
jgi:hypothetical protein